MLILIISNWKEMLWVFDCNRIPAFKGSFQPNGQWSPDDDEMIYLDAVFTLPNTTHPSLHMIVSKASPTLFNPKPETKAV